MIKFKKIYVEITNSCNLNCSFCSKSDRQKKDMSVEDFSHIIKEIKPFTNYIYMHVKGEPLLHKNLSEFFDICDSNSIKVNITTNATLLKNKMDLIAASPCIRQINISLQAYSPMTNISEILEIVRYLSENRKDISFVLRFWALNDFSLVDNKILNQITNFFDLDDETKLKIKTEKNIKIFENIYINKAPLFEWPSLANDHISDTGFCYGLKTHIGILSNGTVVPCCFDGEGVMNLGNIFETPLKEILDSEKTQRIIDSFRDNKLSEELCQKCSYRLLLKNK